LFSQTKGMFQKLRSVIYHAADLAAARQWYIDVTGLQPYFDQPFYVGFDINGSELGIDPDMSKVTPGNSTTALWKVADVQATVDKCVSLGATIHSAPQNVGGDMIVATIIDPFGNNVGLISE
jgi:predicted enzyme related to lactoylglutathione lyase